MVDAVEARPERAFADLAALWTSSFGFTGVVAGSFDGFWRVGTGSNGNRVAESTSLLVEVVLTWLFFFFAVIKQSLMEPRIVSHARLAV